MMKEHKTKKQIIARFLQNSELSAGFCGRRKAAVTFEGRTYMILESDVPYYETLLSDLPEWHRYPDEKPKENYTECLVTHTFRDQRFLDEAVWITRKSDMCFEEDWEGPGFYKENDGEKYRIEVCAWMTKPEPYKEVDRKKVN